MCDGSLSVFGPMPPLASARGSIFLLCGISANKQGVFPSWGVAGMPESCESRRDKGKMIWMFVCKSFECGGFCCAMHCAVAVLYHFNCRCKCQSSTHSVGIACNMNMAQVAKMPKCQKQQGGRKQLLRKRLGGQRNVNCCSFSTK